MSTYHFKGPNDSLSNAEIYAGRFEITPQSERIDGRTKQDIQKIRFNTLEEINISLRGNISVQSNDSNTDTENLTLN